MSDQIAILITGSQGFVGQALMRRLQQQLASDQLFGLDRSTCDLADPEAVHDFFTRHRPEAIVHLAASLDRRPTPEAWTSQWRNTFTAGRLVLEAAAAHGVQRMIMSGSIEELGNQEGELGTDRRASPVSVYGLCKSLLHDVAAFHARQTNMRVDWFRPFIVYGPGQVGSMLMPYAFESARTGTPANFTDGAQQRDFLYIDDLVDWIIASLGAGTPSDGTSSGGQVIDHNIGRGESIPVRTALELIAKQFPGARFNIGAIPRRHGEPDVQVAPKPRASAMAPWTWAPAVSLREGISATAKWHRSTRTEH
jgi:nucleoside-diphosphate-sugar epimerase